MIKAMAIYMSLRAFALGAADFLTQDEIRSRLDELYWSNGSNVVFGYTHVDHCYCTHGPFKPYQYHCPSCGETTQYRDKVLVGSGIDIDKYLIWARRSVKELRALRLDVRIDERTLCATCRRELKIPDGGEIIRIPDIWPSWEGRQDVFPFAVGEKVVILNEPYKNVFGVVRPNQTYWVRAKELEEAIKQKVDRLIDVRMGPGVNYARAMMVTRWGFGCCMPDVHTNGWARYQPYRSILGPLCFQVPKEVVGNLTYAGAKTSRVDIFTPLWTINGKRVVVWESDVQLLKEFLTCEKPSKSYKLRVRVNLLEKLLNPKTIGDEKTKWNPSNCRKRIGPNKSLLLTNDPPCEVEVEVDL